MTQNNCKYSHEHYIGYKLKIENISEVESLINDYKHCHWNVQVYPPITQITDINIDSSCKKETCTICCDSSNLIDVKTVCLHNFHSACINKWVKSNPTCPICRTILCDRLYTVTLELDLNRINEIIEIGSQMPLGLLMNMGIKGALRDKIEDARIKRLLNLEIRFVPFVP